MRLRRSAGAELCRATMLPACPKCGHASVSRHPAHLSSFFPELGTAHVSAALFVLRSKSYAVLLAIGLNERKSISLPAKCKPHTAPDFPLASERDEGGGESKVCVEFFSCFQVLKFRMSRRL